MKLKYYLRGIGIGIIVATIVMAVSSTIHNNNLSDEMIIKEAQKLGMIMPEDTEDSLWGNSSSEDAANDIENDVQDTTQTEAVSEVETESMTEATETETEAATETQAVGETDQTVEVQKVAITIYDTDSARHVALKLKEVGVIENASDFRSYVANKGYAYSIRSGTVYIPVGSTYDEIIDIIVRK